jgi:hypothetical protein
MNAKELKQHDKTGLHIQSRKECKNRRSAASQSDTPENPMVQLQSDMAISTESSLNGMCNI